MSQQRHRSGKSSRTGSQLCLPRAESRPGKLRVVIVGMGGQQDHFNQILAANIQQWGHEAVILPAMTAMIREVSDVEGDILLYDLDDSFRFSMLMTGNRAGAARLASDFLVGYEKRWPRVRLMIALSSRSVSRVTLEQIGAVALLYKPFEMGRLQRYLQVLERLLLEARAPAGSHIVPSQLVSRSSQRTHAHIKSGPKDARILVVEDDVEMASAIRRCLLNEAGYEVKIAFDGLEALEECVAWQPQCIVTDLILPWMNGYQVMRCLAASSSHLAPAFVVLSALTQHELPVNRTYLQGKVVIYVDKPFHIDRLLAAVEQALASWAGLYVLLE